MFDGDDRSGEKLTLRSRIESVLFDGLVKSIVAAARLHPACDPANRGVEVIKNVSYGDLGSWSRAVDIFLPRDRKTYLPCVVYYHGGSFSRQSKEEYWFASLTMARAGFLVFNVDYRLAPQHRYPAAIQDACAALMWVKEQAAALGGDPSTIVCAGDSAGGNLASAVALCTAFRLEEPWAAELYDSGARPEVVIAAGAMFQVSAAERWSEQGLSTFSLNALAEIERNYLPEEWQRFDDAPLADPLLVLERYGRPTRPLPRFYLVSGDRDPLAHDSVRMAKALLAHGAETELKIYPGGVHGFQILFPWLSLSRVCWEDQFEYLGRVLENHRVIVPQPWAGRV